MPMEKVIADPILALCQLTLLTTPSWVCSMLLFHHHYLVLESYAHARIRSVEDYVGKVMFLAELRKSEKVLDMRNIELQDLYNMIDEYGIEVSTARRCRRMMWLQAPPP